MDAIVNFQIQTKSAGSNLQSSERTYKVMQNNDAAKQIILQSQNDMQNIDNHIGQPILDAYIMTVSFVMENWRGRTEFQHTELEEESWSNEKVG